MNRFVYLVPLLLALIGCDPSSEDGSFGLAEEPEVGPAVQLSINMPYRDFDDDVAVDNRVAVGWGTVDPVLLQLIKTDAEGLIGSTQPEEWLSSDPEIASVDLVTGQFIAHKPGTVVIESTAEGLNCALELEIVNASLERVLYDLGNDGVRQSLTLIPGIETNYQLVADYTSEFDFLDGHVLVPSSVESSSDISSQVIDEGIRLKANLTASTNSTINYVLTSPYWTGSQNYQQQLVVSALPALNFTINGEKRFDIELKRGGSAVIDLVGATREVRVQLPESVRNLVEVDYQPSQGPTRSIAINLAAASPFQQDISTEIILSQNDDPNASCSSGPPVCETLALSLLNEFETTFALNLALLGNNDTLAVASPLSARYMNGELTSDALIVDELSNSPSPRLTMRLRRGDSLGSGDSAGNINLESLQVVDAGGTGCSQYVRLVSSTSAASGDIYVELTGAGFSASQVLTCSLGLQNPLGSQYQLGDVDSFEVYLVSNVVDRVVAPYTGDSERNIDQAVGINDHWTFVIDDSTMKSRYPDLAAINNVSSFDLYLITDDRWPLLINSRDHDSFTASASSYNITYGLCGGGGCYNGSYEDSACALSINSGSAESSCSDIKTSRVSLKFENQLNVTNRLVSTVGRQEVPDALLVTSSARGAPATATHQLFHSSSGSSLSSSTLLPVGRQMMLMNMKLINPTQNRTVSFSVRDNNGNCGLDPFCVGSPFRFRQSSSLSTSLTGINQIDLLSQNQLAVCTGESQGTQTQRLNEQYTSFSVASPAGLNINFVKPQNSAQGCPTGPVLTPQEQCEADDQYWWDNQCQVSPEPEPEPELTPQEQCEADDQYWWDNQCQVSPEPEPEPELTPQEQCEADDQYWWDNQCQVSPEPEPEPELTPQEQCEADDQYWWDNQCQISPEPESEPELTPQEQCEADDQYWWDNQCQISPEPELTPQEQCEADKQFWWGDQCQATPEPAPEPELTPEEQCEADRQFWWDNRCNVTPEPIPPSGDEEPIV